MIARNAINHIKDPAGQLAGLPQHHSQNIPGFQQTLTYRMTVSDLGQGHQNQFDTVREAGVCSNQTDPRGGRQSRVGEAATAGLIPLLVVLRLHFWQLSVGHLVTKKGHSGLTWVVG